MAAKRITLDPADPLRSLLAALGLTQEEAAERALGSRDKRTIVSNAIHRGDRIGLDHLRSLAAGLGRRITLAAVEQDPGPEEKSTPDA